MRIAVALLLSLLAGPISGADDYIDLCHAGSGGAARSASFGIHGAPVDLAEDDGEHRCRCSCASCLPAVTASPGPAWVVPDKAPVLALTTSDIHDSSYRREIFRPPSA